MVTVLIPGVEHDLQTHGMEVKAFAAKFRDERIANILKVRAKTLIDYKQARMMGFSWVTFGGFLFGDVNGWWNER